MSGLWLNEGAVVDWLIKSTALVALAWTVALTARVFNGSAALRHLLWLSAIVSAAALPAVAALTPLRLGILPASYELRAAQDASVSAPGVWTAGGVLFVVYACGAAALLLRIVVGQLRLNAVWRNALTIDSFNAESGALATAFGLRRRVTVRIADHSAAPMTWGVLQPKIVLPAAAAGWPSAQRRLVMMHELTHVARVDSLTQLLVSIALAFTWFHPALWFAAARMRREQEHACDDRVLLAGASAHDYARTLLDVAVGRCDGVAAAAVTMAASSQLEARVKAIIARRPRAFSLAGAAGTMLGAVAALMTAAIAAPAPPTVARAARVESTRARAEDAQNTADEQAPGGPPVRPSPGAPPAAPIARRHAAPVVEPSTAPDPLTAPSAIAAP